MQFCVAGDEATARATLEAAAAEAGWRLGAGPEPLWRLTPSEGESPLAASAWVAADTTADGTVLTLWLPDQVDPRLRERLESALDALSPTCAADKHQPLIRRLRRIEGQIRGLQRMITEERDCEAVMTQITAATTALKQTAAKIVSEHLADCIRQEMDAGGDVSQVNQRLLNILF